MIILKAEAALAVAEAFADNVASGVLTPPLRVAPWHRIGVCPALALGFGVEESWPLLLFLLLARSPWG